MKKNIKKVLFALIIGLFIMFIGNDVYAGRCDYDYLYGTITIADDLATARQVLAETGNNTDTLYINAKLFAIVRHDIRDEGGVVDHFKDKIIFINDTTLGRYGYTKYEWGGLDEEKNSIWHNAFFQNGTFKCVDQLYYNFTSETTLIRDQLVYTLSPYQEIDGKKFYDTIYPKSSTPTPAPTATPFNKPECTSAQISSAELQVMAIKNKLRQELSDFNTSLATYDAETYNHYLDGVNNSELGHQINSILTKYRAELKKYLEEEIPCALTEEKLAEEMAKLDEIVDRYIADINTTMNNAVTEAYNNGTIDTNTYNNTITNIDTAQTTAEEKIQKFEETIGKWYSNLINGDKILDCDGLLDAGLVDIINTLLTWIRIIVPIIVIILGTVDFSKAVLNAEKDEMKQAVTRLTKRIVIAIIIFFVPTLIHLLVDIFNQVSDIHITDLPDCGIK